MEVAGFGPPFFPKLEYLIIDRLFMLKGWWPKTGVDQLVNTDNGSNQEPHADELICWASSPALPLLREIVIRDSLKMTSIPAVCPLLKELRVSDFNRSLELSSSRASSFGRDLEINNVGLLKSMPTEYCQSVVSLTIADGKVESLSEVKESFPTCLLSSLHSLSLIYCPKLRSDAGGWLANLSALQELCIYKCPKLIMSNSGAEKEDDDDDEDGIPWRHLPQSLHSLELGCLENLEKLPERMQFCTSLQSLVISECQQLKFLPKWLPKLTSLKKLQLRSCSKQLKERCQNPNGEDWPLIQNIPLTFIEHEEEDSD